jgi:hypothetical protein
MNTKYPIVLMAAVLVTSAFAMGITSVPFQTAAAQPTVNQGQCMKDWRESDATPEQAHQACHGQEFLLLNQGECLKLARENPEQSWMTEEECKQVFSPNPRY